LKYKNKIVLIVRNCLHIDNNVSIYYIYTLNIFISNNLKLVLLLSLSICIDEPGIQSTEFSLNIDLSLLCNSTTLESLSICCN
jgi:hypothetical protein